MVFRLKGYQNLSFTDLRISKAKKTGVSSCLFSKITIIFLSKSFLAEFIYTVHLWIPPQSIPL